jgi:hypothetical protein
MPRQNQFRSRLAELSHSGPPLIFAGLAALILFAAIPKVPALTALSILTLGATNATLDRFRNSAAIVHALLLHAATYAGLYALFIGATLHAAAGTHGGALGSFQAVDVAASFLPTAVSIMQIAIALRRQFEPQR